MCWSGVIPYQTHTWQNGAAKVITVPGDRAQRGGGAHIDNNQVATRVLLHRTNRIGNTVGTDFLGVTVANIEARLAIAARTK